MNADEHSAIRAKPNSTEDTRPSISGAQNFCIMSEELIQAAEIPDALIAERTQINQKGRAGAPIARAVKADTPIETTHALCKVSGFSMDVNCSATSGPMKDPIPMPPKSSPSLKAAADSS
mmetsp:Transcript_928/g.1223  ORF Transcript_928/g.1223 Transcript_928/m.1223 type:complete len:120 (-) Transcript_928:266-625(-)